MYQPSLFNEIDSKFQFPSTRYQGSKLKIANWIWDNIRELDFETALDAFGGTATISYLLKTKNKRVTYNDFLRFNHIIGKALIENQTEKLSADDVRFILEKHDSVAYQHFIEKTFHNIFFTDEENKWLDIVVQNIALIDDQYKKAVAYYALFQSCIIKRPYNLFHRKNLYMRTAKVKRDFGNKTTWDTPFEDHFLSFVQEANQCIFDSGTFCISICQNALEIKNVFDLVYIDTPYINKSGTGVDYLDFYHFLEGIIDYHHWSEKVNKEKKHLPLMGKKSLWSNKNTITEAFHKLFEHYSDSKLVISYRSDGIPSEKELENILKSFKPKVRTVHFGEYKYVLSKNGDSKEILFIAE